MRLELSTIAIAVHAACMEMNAAHLGFTDDPREWRWYAKRIKQLTVDERMPRAEALAKLKQEAKAKPWAPMFGSA